jgi:hypothetical protein
VIARLKFSQPERVRLDYHLHTFRMRRPHQRKMIEIGIPDEGEGDDEVLPG